MPVRIRSIYRTRRRHHLHQNIPEAFPLEETLLRSRLSGDLDGLAAATQHHADALVRREGARWIGIRKRRKELAKGVHVRVPTRPAKPRRSAHQRAAQQNLANTRLVLSRHAEHVLDEFPQG